MIPGPPIEIEDGIPPPRTRNRAKYPFDSMAIGQSFFAPAVTSVNRQYWERATGRKFIARKATKDGVIGIRCWRSS
jgi:hypothetical protein